MISDIPAGEWKIANLFYSETVTVTETETKPITTIVQLQIQFKLQISVLQILTDLVEYLRLVEAD
jgi:hypothetical protein